MIRLINANRLWLEMASETAGYCYPCDMVCKAIKNTEAVDAVPIEFIRERMEGYYKNGYMEFGACLEALIEDWRKNNDTTD